MASIRCFFLFHYGFSWIQGLSVENEPHPQWNTTNAAKHDLQCSRSGSFTRGSVDWIKLIPGAESVLNWPLKQRQAAAVTQSHLHERRTHVMIHYGSVNADTSHARTETFLSVCRLITTSSRTRQDTGGRRFPCRTQNCLSVVLKTWNLLHLPRAGVKLTLSFYTKRYLLYQNMSLQSDCVWERAAKMFWEVIRPLTNTEI